ARTETAPSATNMDFCGGTTSVVPAVIRPHLAPALLRTTQFLPSELDGDYSDCPGLSLEKLRAIINMNCTRIVIKRSLVETISADSGPALTKIPYKLTPMAFEIIARASAINYAQIEGIHSLGGAIVFAIIYIPLFIFYVLRSIRYPTYVFIVLSLFCLIRTVSFILRAVLADSNAAGQNLNLVIAQEVLYNVGVFGVIYSAYTLALDRDILADTARIFDRAPGPVKLISRIMHNRHMIRIILLVAVVLGIIGATDASSSNPSTVNTGNSLRHASIYIFLVVSILLVIETFILSVSESTSGRTRIQGVPFGTSHGVYILSAIAGFILLREAFFAATTNNPAQQINEHFWYPLAALPELFAVVLFAVPGLVPTRDELAKEEEQHGRV
ncbi:hypothetical protein A0H81_14930, partial [Grifola frondosa]